MKPMYIGDWVIEGVLDDDGHLTVFITHSDESEIYQCDPDIGKENEWANRFTTEQIEKKYWEKNETKNRAN